MNKEPFREQFLKEHYISHYKEPWKIAWMLKGFLACRMHIDTQCTNKPIKLKW